MSVVDHTVFTAALPLTEGLLDWTRRQGPDMWHEIALSADFSAPTATIDLLLAANWITLQPACDRATALVLLARATRDGLHTGQCPLQLAPEAARTFARVLHAALAANCFLVERVRLGAADLALIDAQLGEDSPFALTLEQRRTTGRLSHHAPYALVGQRPVPARTQARAQTRQAARAA